MNIKNNFSYHDKKNKLLRIPKLLLLLFSSSYLFSISRNFLYCFKLVAFSDNP